MNHLTEHQQYLLLGKLAGNLDPDEMVAFEELMQNADARSAFDALSNQVADGHGKQSFAYVREPHFWEDLKGHYEQQQRSHLSRRILYITSAAVLITIVVGIWLYRSPTISYQTDAISEKFKSAKVELRLANGELITIDDQPGNLKTGSVTLTNDNGTLSYKIAGAESGGMNSLKVPAGMDYRVILHDGSEVWLNSETRVDFPFVFSKKERLITISGEAYVKVTRDERRPFVVQIAGKRVEVLGTVFNVNSYDSSAVKVSLVTGSVYIKGEKESLLLKPGEQARFSASGSSISRSKFDERLVLSWMNGVFYLEDTPLPEIIHVINRWFDIKAVIDNPALEKRTFVGAINKKQDIHAFLDDLRAVSKIDTWFDGDGVLHFR
jgi:Fe2+-dicitrate sensor, membrane component